MYTWKNGKKVRLQQHLKYDNRKTYLQTNESYPYIPFVTYISLSLIPLPNVVTSLVDFVLGCWIQKTENYTTHAPGRGLFLLGDDCTFEESPSFSTESQTSKRTSPLLSVKLLKKRKYIFYMRLVREPNLTCRLFKEDCAKNIKIKFKGTGS